MDPHTQNQMTHALSGIVEIQSYLLGLRRPGATLAQRILGSPRYRDFIEHRDAQLSLEIKSNIIGTGASADPLTGVGKPFLDPGARQPLVIRDLLPTYKTDAASIDLPVKTASTNSAAVQNREGVAHGESAFTFEADFRPVQTIAHFVPVSRQVMEDSAVLDAFLQTELLAQLGEKVEDQLLNGDGTNSKLFGLLNDATAYATPSPTPTTKLGVIREAIRQVQVSKFRPTGVILHPTDWARIETTTSSSPYIAGPAVVDGKVWRVPVVTTTAIAQGTFLVGDFNRCAAVFGRESAAVQVSRHNDTNFQKGMLTVKASERLCLVVTNPDAMRKGSLP